MMKMRAVSKKLTHRRNRVTLVDDMKKQMGVVRRLSVQVPEDLYQMLVAAASDYPSLTVSDIARLRLTGNAIIKEGRIVIIPSARTETNKLATAH